MRSIQSKYFAAFRLLWAVMCLALIPAAVSANDLSPELKSGIADGLREICNPVVRGGTPFKEAIEASTLPLEDISVDGTPQARLKISNNRWITFGQQAGKPETCTLLAGTDTLTVRKLVTHTANSWNCRPRSTKRRDRRAMIQCPDSRIYLFFYVDGDNVTVAFVFTKNPKDVPEKQE